MGAEGMATKERKRASTRPTVGPGDAQEMAAAQRLVQAALGGSGHEASVEEVLTRRAFAVRVRGTRWVVKVVPPAEGKAARLFLRVTLAWEQAVLRALQGCTPSIAKIPRILDVPGTGVVAMEWIDGTEPTSMSVQMRMRALVEFHTLPMRPRPPFPFGLAWRLMHERGPVFLRRRVWALRRRRGWRAAWRCARFLTRANLRQTRLGFPFHAHGDPHIGNLIESPTKGLYWIDFESVHPERRWMMDDVVYRAFSWKHLAFRKDRQRFVVEYLRALREKMTDGFRVDAVLQFRVALVHRALVMLHNAKRRNLDQIAAFLDEVLVDDDAFRRWADTAARDVLEEARRLGWVDDAPQ